MTTAQQKWTDGLFRNVLATLPVAALVGGWIWAQSGWQATTDARLKSLEERQTNLALEQAAGRGRGDALRAAVADLKSDVAVVRTQVAGQTDLLTEIRGDVKRMAQQRFGDASQPTGTLSTDGTPWQ